MQFDFLSHFKNIGNSILSMFNLKAPGDDDENGDDDNIQIEVVDEASPSISKVANKKFLNITKQLNQTLSQSP